MNEAEFKQRTKKLALMVIGVYGELPDRGAGRVIGNQLLRAGTSVGSNYRAACCGKFVADMVSKLGTVEEEADETMNWLELLVEAEITPLDRVRDSYQEAKEILAMTVASRRTLKSRTRKKLKIGN